MRTSVLAILASLALIVPLHAQDPNRELGAHVHGNGALDIAIEGQRLVIELRAPGADISGIEGKAETAEAKAAVARAIASLEKPLDLFGLPAAAKCTVVSAKVSAGEDEDHAQPGAPAAKDGDAKAPAAGSAPAAHDHDHSDFDADYEFACAAPAELTTIDLPFFKQFPKSQKLVVQVVTAKGQTSLEATPAKPRIDLGALAK